MAERQIKAQLTITLFNDDATNVNGPIDIPVLCHQLLEAGRQNLLMHWTKKLAGSIQLATPSDVPPEEKIFGVRK